MQVSDQHFISQICVFLLFGNKQIHKVRLTSVAILFHQRGEKLGAPLFLTAGFNPILKTLIDNIWKPSRENHKQCQYVVGT